MGFTLLFLVLVFYFLPTIIAYNKKRSNAGAIFVLNFFLGWSGIGWIVALVWATTSGDQKQIVVNNTSSAHELEKLAELKTKGIISEAEFEAKKKKILDA